MEKEIAVGLAAFAGGMSNALIGWAQAPAAEPFIWRKFVTSIVRSVVAGAGVLAAGDYTNTVVTMMVLAGAFGLGYAWDNGLHAASAPTAAVLTSIKDKLTGAAAKQTIADLQRQIDELKAGQTKPTDPPAAPPAAPAS